MAEEKSKSVFIENLAILAEPENFQKYIIGTKGNGQPRALYDVIRDLTGIKKKKKGKKKKKKGQVPAATIDFYTSYKKKKGKKKKKKDKKYWHI